jgi:hypothetical protein
MSAEQTAAASLLQTVAAWGAAGIGLAGSATFLRRRLSRDRTEMTKDRVEGDLVQLLLRERDEAQKVAREALSARHAASEAVARLMAKTEAQASEIARLQREFTAFKRMLVRVYPETRLFLGSDFQVPESL